MTKQTFYVVVNSAGEYRCSYDYNPNGWDNEFPLARLYWIKDGATEVAHKYNGTVKRVTVTVHD